jgi:CHAD domain-containing protein
MARFDKWLTDLGPDAPVPRAARKALASRLRAVEHYLQEAAQVSGDDTRNAEAVHQLRIWTRRAAAALRLFEPVLPQRRCKRLKRTLRRIRRTAGQARDCDVLAERLESGELPGLAHTVVHLRSQRKTAERELAKLHNKLVRRGKLRRQGDKLRKKARWRGGKQALAFAPWCREQLQPLCDEFFTLAGGDLSRDTALHQLRLSGKRLRYGLELAPAAIPAATHCRLYDDLSEVQDKLGAVCDAVVAAGRLREWLAECKDRTIAKELRATLKREQQELARRKRRFARWWTVRRREHMRRAWNKGLEVKETRVKKPQ